MSNLSNLTAWMRAQVGTAEQPKGSNNVVYNTHYYGRPVSGGAYPWCVAFLWAGFNACGLSHLFCGGGKTASVSYVADYAQRHGLWVTGNYQPGDLLCYGAEHIGFCVSSGGDTVSAIEGNYSDKVAQVTRRLSEITGAYRPAYGDLPELILPDVPDVPATPDIQPEPEPLPPLPDHDFQSGDIVSILPGAVYWEGAPVPPWVLNHNWIVRSVYGERAVINASEDGFYHIMSAINIRYLNLIKTAAEAAVEAAAVTEYTVRPGDTLWGIAQKFLGNGTKWTMLQKENGIKGEHIYPGQVIKIPKK